MQFVQLVLMRVHQLWLFEKSLQAVYGSLLASPPEVRTLTMVGNQTQVGMPEMTPITAGVQFLVNPGPLRSQH